MSIFVRTNSTIWGSVNQSDYKDSIVFIEDTEQIYSNGLYYGGKNNNGLLLEKITFSEESILLNPDKFYASDTILETLDITLNGDITKMNTYFVEFICDNTCVILPSNIKWKNNIVPDFTKTAIMTIKIQDDTAYLIDCRPLYSVLYTAAKKVHPNRTDAFGSEIIWTTEDKFILNEPATEIKEGAFEGNQDLISITIPNTVKLIGSNAFSGCSNLQDIIEYEGYYNEWCKIELGEGWKENTNLMYVNCKDGLYYLGPCVTFTAQQDNSSIGLRKLSTNQTLEYSRDRSNWFNMNTSTNISLNNRDKVYVRGILSSDNDGHYTQFKMSGKIAASGNCNAIWDYQDLNTPLKAYCGYQMFQNCTSLTTAPELPATVLQRECYANMFAGCTSLTTAPEILPATVLAEYCYQEMFNNCTALTTVPELPATKLTKYCYSAMFGGCTSLTTAPELPATTLANDCYNSMFVGCTSLVTAPVLPATMLVTGCYGWMFEGCTSLNYIKCLATDISVEYCTSTWVYGVSSTGTFIKHPDMNSWSTGINGIPFGWTTENAVL